MSQSICILCPGQGAQAVGMGQDIYDKSAAAKAAFDEACDVLSVDLRKLCFEGPDEQLSRTDVSQPAILVCSVASYRAAVEAGTIDEASITTLAGLSLGEYTALHLGGSMSYVDTLKLVQLRGQCMQQAAEAADSGMLALIGVDDAAADTLCTDAGEGDVLVPANYNTKGQIVISGATAAIDRAEKLAGERGFKSVRLPVAGAFHSPFMAPAADKMQPALADAPIEMPRGTVYSNVTAAPHTSVDEIRTLLLKQITAPVMWTQTLEKLLSEEMQFIELAPGKSLAGMAKRIARRTPILNLQEQQA